MKRPIILIAMLIATSPAIADTTIKPENWKSCSVKSTISDKTPDWSEIPHWARAPHLVKIYEEPRILALHGLCNEKFKRIVLCLPGWDDPGADKNDPFHRVCSAWEAYRAAKERKLK